MPHDALRPSAESVLDAWVARVRANREQVEHYRETSPADFYAGIANVFRADPRRESEPTLDALLELTRSDETWLDIGAGGGRFALPLALRLREVVALDPSEGMLRVLREGMAEHGIDNIRVVAGRWPESAADLSADVSLMSHLGYDVEDIGPFLDAMEAATRRMCVAVLLERPPPTPADRLWPAIHGVERAALPALPEFVTLLLARGRLPEVHLVERGAQAYTSPDVLLTWLRGQLWTQPDGPKDRELQRLLNERIEERDGRFTLDWSAQRVGIVTWAPRSDQSSS
jgi:SAM-dependent methyltransferase